MDHNSIVNCGGVSFTNAGPIERPASRRTVNGLPRRSCRFLSPEELAAGESTNWHELEIRGCVRNLSPHLFTLHHLTALFLCDNELQYLPADIAKLTSLRVLDASNNKLSTLPAALGDLSTLEQLYVNNNLIRVLPCELGKLYRLKTLGLLGNPLTPEINQIYRLPGGTVKLLQYLMCQLCATFTVMCYNVLSDKYASPIVYSYCPLWALNWSYRRRAILQEMIGHKPDVISLQEVETEQFRLFFVPELRKHGYDGIFSPKSRARTMDEENRKHVDGCAMFWKTDRSVELFYLTLLIAFVGYRFKLKDEHLIEFRQLAIANAEGCQPMLNRVMTRDNIALVGVLQLQENFACTCVTDSSSPGVVQAQLKVPLVVCTAHIHWHPEFCDVKLVQTMMLVQELDHLVDEIAHNHGMVPADVPVILCGDLNSLPNSGVHEFLSKGRIRADHGDFKEFRNQSCLQRMSAAGNESKVYTHRLALESAYDANIMPFTNFTNYFKGVIDYVFATPRTLIKVGLLGSVDVAWFQQNKIVGCPHPSIPSDHFPLLVEYAFASSVLTQKAPKSP
ncbi:CCR4 NOT transcription complex subunit 6 family [Trichuris trichiura]|uniref:poly(A)-specific ribonuclease n=1 Tax=Trichuris trichiura TaxID=36087 RepID=A0A077Z210_TRITR|nr:CCR4 NOT transcription complex subunit 6 family [Trichuris trichiura]